MPTPEVGTKGAQLDLLVRQGATCGPFQTTLRDGGGLPIDITGATLRAQIRKTADAVSSVAAAVFTITDAANGEFSWQFDADDTTAITADPADEDQPDSVYVWDMEIEYSATLIDPLLWGNVRVFREVTKP